MNLGNKILELRKRLGLSQEQLGEKVNVTRQTISNWELGETSPNIEQLKLLSRVFQISIDELLDNDINNLLVERVSNTEKLAGIIIKILKGFGIFLLLYLLFILIAIILFSGHHTTTSNSHSITIECSLNEKDYSVSVGSDGYFNCSNCDKNLQKKLVDMVDYSDVDESIQKIGNYFQELGGFCE